jgi:hypothetical protein
LASPLHLKLVGAKIAGIFPIWIASFIRVAEVSFDPDRQVRIHRLVDTEVKFLNRNSLGTGRHGHDDSQ